MTLDSGDVIAQDRKTYVDLVDELKPRVSNYQTLVDAALVAPFGRRLLEYGVTDLVPEPWFNLYNNIWNTNFPMWFGDDVRFRFVLHDRE